MCSGIILKSVHQFKFYFQIFFQQVIWIISTGIFLFVQWSIFLDFLPRTTGFFSLPISRFARPFCSQSQWRIYLCLSWIFSKQLFADFFLLFPFLQCVHILNLKIFRIMAWKTSIQNYFTLILSFSPFPKGSTTLCMKNNVACVYRWHAKPFLLYTSRNLYSNFYFCSENT